MKKGISIRWKLVGYDMIILGIVEFLMIFLSVGTLPVTGIIAHVLLTGFCVFTVRLVCRVYGQIWRYGGIQCYIILISADAGAFLLTLVLEQIFFVNHLRFETLLATACMNLLGALMMRMFYRYAFKCGNDTTRLGKFLFFLLKLFGGKGIVGERILDATKIRIAIIGAGRIGASLAEELLNNNVAAYVPICFVDVNEKK